MLVRIIQSDGLSHSTTADTLRADMTTVVGMEVEYAELAARRLGFRVS